jgi:hypothetical protein
MRGTDPQSKGSDQMTKRSTVSLLILKRNCPGGLICEIKRGIASKENMKKFRLKQGVLLNKYKEQNC